MINWQKFFDDEEEITKEITKEIMRASCEYHT